MNAAFALHLMPWDGGPMIGNVSRILHETSTMSMP